MIISCNGVIYVDNPPMDYGELAKKNRDCSRKLLLDHLSNCQETHKPYLKTWDKLYLNVSNYMKRKKELEEGKGEWMKEKLESIGNVTSWTKERLKVIENRIARESETELICSIEVPTIIKADIQFKHKGEVCSIS